MSDLRKLIEGMDRPQRAGAIAVLDRLTRPLTRKEMERHLTRKSGLTRSRARELMNAIKGLHIVALIGPENE